MNHNTDAIRGHGGVGPEHRLPSGGAEELSDAQGCSRRQQKAAEGTRPPPPSPPPWKADTSLTNTYLPQVQGLAVAVDWLSLVRGAGGHSAGAIQHQGELGQGACGTQI